MKTLLLLRHAKSSHDDSTIQDIDRRLNERGRNDAILIGKYLHQKKVHLDLALSSPATRARQTIELVLKSAGQKIEPTFEKRIYEATARAFVQTFNRNR